MPTSIFSTGALKLLSFGKFFVRKQQALDPKTIKRSSQCSFSVTQCASIPPIDKKQFQTLCLNRPLRVRHIVDAGQQRYDAGRMVISGRMADVCAELERLAAGEAAMS
jgi:hypothetical protein